MDDATWGMFQEHYTGPFGADADHLKTIEDLETCFKVGFTMFTVDLSDYINNQPDRMSTEELNTAFEKLFDDNNAQQLIHITYGSVLQVRDEDGRYVFRDRLMQILDESEEEYFELLDRHISKHMEAFGLRRK